MQRVCACEHMQRCAVPEDCWMQRQSRSPEHCVIPAHILQWASRTHRLDHLLVRLHAAAELLQHCTSLHTGMGCNTDYRRDTDGAWYGLLEQTKRNNLYNPVMNTDNACKHDAQTNKIARLDNSNRIRLVLQVPTNTVELQEASIPRLMEADNTNGIMEGRELKVDDPVEQNMCNEHPTSMNHSADKHIDTFVQTAATTDRSDVIHTDTLVQTAARTDRSDDIHTDTLVQTAATTDRSDDIHTDTLVQTAARTDRSDDIHTDTFVQMGDYNGVDFTRSKESPVIDRRNISRGKYSFKNSTDSSGKCLTPDVVKMHIKEHHCASTDSVSCDGRPPSATTSRAMPEDSELMTKERRASVSRDNSLRNRNQMESVNARTLCNGRRLELRENQLWPADSQLLSVADRAVAAGSGVRLLSYESSQLSSIRNTVQQLEECLRDTDVQRRRLASSVSQLQTERAELIRQSQHALKQRAAAQQQLHQMQQQLAATEASVEQLHVQAEGQTRRLREQRQQHSRREAALRRETEQLRGHVERLLQLVAELQEERCRDAAALQLQERRETEWRRLGGRLLQAVERALEQLNSVNSEQLQLVSGRLQYSPASQYRALLQAVTRRVHAETEASGLWQESSRQRYENTYLRLQNQRLEKQLQDAGHRPAMMTSEERSRHQSASDPAYNSLSTDSPCVSLQAGADDVSSQSSEREHTSSSDQRHTAATPRRHSRRRHHGQTTAAQRAPNTVVTWAQLIEQQQVKQNNQHAHSDTLDTDSIQHIIDYITSTALNSAPTHDHE